MAPTAAHVESPEKQPQNTFNNKAELTVDQLIAAVAIPPIPAAINDPKIGSRVRHIIAKRSAPVSVLIAEALNVPRDEYVMPLLSFGAVFTCLIVPTPLDASNDSQETKLARNAAMARVEKKLHVGHVISHSMYTYTAFCFYTIFCDLRDSIPVLIFLPYI